MRVITFTYLKGAKQLSPEGFYLNIWSRNGREGSGRFEPRIRSWLSLVIQLDQRNLLKYFNHK